MDSPPVESGSSELATEWIGLVWRDAGIDTSTMVYVSGFEAADVHVRFVHRDGSTACEVQRMVTAESTGRWDTNADCMITGTLPEGAVHVTSDVPVAVAGLIAHRGADGTEWVPLTWTKA